MEPAQSITQEPLLAKAAQPDLAVLDDQPLQPVMAQHASSSTSANLVRVLPELP